MQSPVGSLHCPRSVLTRLYVLYMYRIQRKADEAKYQHEWHRERDTNETATERCMQSSAGKLSVALCASVDCSLHRDERKSKQAKYRQDWNRKNPWYRHEWKQNRDEKETEDAR